MTRIVTAAFAAILLLVVAPSVQAQGEPSARQIELARGIVEATSTEAMYRAALESTIPLARQGFAASIPGATSAQLDEAMDVMLEIMMETYPDVVEASTMAYARRFTEAELAELHAFYHTELGRKMAAELPGLTTELAQVGERLGQQAVERNIGRLQAIFQ